MLVRYLSHQHGPYLMEVPEGTTVGSFVRDQNGSFDPEKDLVRVNRAPVAMDHRLNPGDWISVTPRKMAAAAPTIAEPRATRESSHAPELEGYCRKLGITDHLARVLDVVAKRFPNLDQLHLVPQTDPETGDEYLVIRVRLSDDMESILDQYDAFLKDFVATVPPEARLKIRLVYDVW